MSIMCNVPIGGWLSTKDYPKVHFNNKMFTIIYWDEETNKITEETKTTFMVVFRP